MSVIISSNSLQSCDFAFDSVEHFAQAFVHGIELDLSRHASDHLEGFFILIRALVANLPSELIILQDLVPDVGLAVQAFSARVFKLLRGAWK